MPPLEIPINSEVLVWTRIANDCILLLGEGAYVDNNYINGSYFPVVKLNDGRELTVHYQGVYVGKKEAVAETCKKFQGDIIEWDIQDYLSGKRPIRDPRDPNATAPTSSSKPTGLAKAQAYAEPKTATDKLLYLKREIELEENKIKLAEQLKEASLKVIAEKRAQMATMKQSVLEELARLDDPTIPATAVVAKAAPEVKPIVPAAPVVLPPQDHFDAAAKQVSEED